MSVIEQAGKNIIPKEESKTFQSTDFRLYERDYPEGNVLADGEYRTMDIAHNGHITGAHNVEITIKAGLYSEDVPVIYHGNLQGLIDKLAELDELKTQIAVKEDYNPGH
jgi:hypothetical protein